MKKGKSDRQGRAKEPEQELSEERKSYLSGLKRYRDKGIVIKIDGKEADIGEWNKIFEVRDSSFYMPDFVADQDTGRLKEIRFDRVYNK